MPIPGTVYGFEVLKQPENFFSPKQCTIEDQAQITKTLFSVV